MVEGNKFRVEKNVSELYRRDKFKLYRVRCVLDKKKNVLLILLLF